MPSLLDHLNPEQRAAVTLPPQPALILAGAGSGKTRVLTTRIAWLLQTGQVGQSGILAVTFTNKAAREMLTRLSVMLPINARGMWIGTFHGLCNRLLRAHWRDAALPQTFQILDTADQLAAVKRMLKALNVDDEKFPPRELQYFIAAQKEAGLRPHAVDAWDDITRRKVELYQEYEAQCQREGVVDFAELLLRCYELLERNEPIRRHYQMRFRHILVDEFQDTNVLQYKWLKLLAGYGTPEPAAVFAVGDDDQSIYGFRGAEVGNMRDFEREFHVAHIIKLEQNYRSDGNILDAANAIIANNAKRLGKNLWTDQGSGEPIRVYEAATDLDEAHWIVEEIQQLVRDGVSRSDVAILYRSNAQSRVIEHQLFSIGMPYRVYGGLRFFERQEIKHALAYLRLVANADDDTAFTRVVNFPARGIGARSLEQLSDAARTYGTSLYATVPHLTGKPAQSIGAFVRLIEEMRKTVRDLPLHEIIDHMLDASGLREHYRHEKEGEDRLANLDELINAAVNFASEDHSTDEDAPADDLSRFLSYASLEAGEHQADAGQDAVQLMTVHAAKGLEFDVVFITGLEDGLFPHENSIMDPDGLEEERRLMYVAITRARQRLYLSLAQTRMLHGQTRYAIRSRFLDEIPDELLKWLTPRVQHAFGGYVAPHGRANDSRSPKPDAPRATTTRNPKQDLGGFRLGQRVRHARFGEGVIMSAEGSGERAHVIVRFEDVGEKQLMLAMAKLEPI